MAFLLSCWQSSAVSPRGSASCQSMPSSRSTPPRTEPRRIGILGFDGVADLAFVGPAQAFSSAFVNPDDADVPHAAYEVATVGLTSDRFISESGLVLQAQQTIDDAPPFDTLIVPGGRGIRRSDVSGPVAEWIAERAPKTRRIVSICTGIYGVAPSGLLDHRRVTTHWRFVRDVARRFPRLDMQENALFVQDGKFFTSAGGTAGIDLAMALIAQDHGSETALEVARDLLVYLRRDGGQEQYAEPDAGELELGNELGPIARWIEKHLGDDLRIEHLAKRAGVGKVHFIRQFKSSFGVTPGAFIKNRRLNEARRRLLAGEPTASVASAVGFRSPLYFAQEFKWRFGSGPDEYQSRFRLAPAANGFDEQEPAIAAASCDGRSLRHNGQRWDRRARRTATAGERAAKRYDLALDAA